jgi:hypothetical protein
VDRSPRNLAAHLGRLEGFGYVTIARDELIVGRAMRTTATLTQSGITALERHVENLKVLGIRLGALTGADSGSRGEAGHPSPSDRRRRKVYWYYE